jgi:hypothetical protein
VIYDDGQGAEIAYRQGEQDILAEMRAQFATAHAGGASSNDIVQLLDDFLTSHGQPTVLYT